MPIDKTITQGDKHIQIENNITNNTVTTNASSYWFSKIDVHCATSYYSYIGGCTL